jgi:hypothetical protein
MKRVPAVPLLCAALLCWASLAPTGRAGETDNPVEQGLALRGAVDTQYEDWKKAHRLPETIQDIRDLTALIRRYVNAGDSLTATRVLLRSAGCTLYRTRQGHELGTRLLGGVFEKKFTFSVDVTPDTGGTGGTGATISSVTATLSMSYLPQVH